MENSPRIELKGGGKALLEVHIDHATVIVRNSYPHEDARVPTLLARHDCGRGVGGERAFSAILTALTNPEWNLGRLRARGCVRSGPSAP